MSLRQLQAAGYNGVFLSIRALALRNHLMSTVNSFGTRTPLVVGARTCQIFSLPTLQRAGFPEIGRLPFSLKILLENLLRHEDGRFVKASDIEALARWDVKSPAIKEISFAPARVL